MFELNSAIANWLRRLSLRDGLTDDDLLEVESHIRDQVDALVEVGLTVQQAFFRAIREFGEEEDLSRSYRRANWERVVGERATRAPFLVAHHLKLAVRSAIKHSGYTAINLFGLAVGMACLMIIVLYVQDELSYDRFHRDADRIYRVAVDRVNADAVEPRIQTPDALGPAIGREIPDVEYVTRLFPAFFGKYVLTREDKSFAGQEYLMVESSFFDIFTFSFLRGNGKSAVADPSSIVLTESLARTLFGEDEAIGQTLTLDGASTLTVSAVIEDVPSQSHFHFEFLLPRPTRFDDCWNANCGHSYTYIKLTPGAVLSDVDAKIQKLVDANDGEVRKDVYFTQPLVGLEGIHLASHREHELAANGNKLYINILFGAAAFIILIAGINYVNLATARSSIRAKEIGVRKVVGALRRTLVRQFLVESVLMAVVAGILAIGLTAFTLPFFNSIMQRELSLWGLGNESVWLLLGAVVILFGVASGLYPALYLSSFKPISVLKNLRGTGSPRFFFREILVVFQFVLAALLIVGTLVVQKQLEFIQAADLGFDKDRVLIIKNFDKIPYGDANFTVRSKIAAIAGVASVGSTTDIVGQGDSIWGSIKAQGSDQEISVSAAHVDYDYLETVGIELKEGRQFSPQFETERSPLSAILNETAVERLGLEGSVLGQLIDDSAGRTSKIVGVVKDFHFVSLYDEIGPFVFFWTNRSGVVTVKIHGGDVQGTIRRIEGTWARFVPNLPMDYYFLDARIDQVYRSEQNFRALFAVMTGLSLLIACLGMFGLVAFTAERRTKEIGVRKVLGASMPNVVALLSKDFISLVLLANLIAWPVAYWVMQQWLRRFAYHTNMSAGIFVFAGIIALLLTIFTVGWHAFQAAAANPADTLKYE